MSLSPLNALTYARRRSLAVALVLKGRQSAASITTTYDQRCPRRRYQATACCAGVRVVFVCDEEDPFRRSLRGAKHTICQLRHYALVATN